MAARKYLVVCSTEYIDNMDLSLGSDHRQVIIIPGCQREIQSRFFQSELGRTQDTILKADKMTTKI